MTAPTTEQTHPISLPGDARLRLADVFPIRYYRRRANPHRVAKNLIVSNITFAVGAAIGGLLTAPSLVEEGDTVGSIRIGFAVFFMMLALVAATISFVLFLWLSKRRARRELAAHTETL